MPTIEEHATLAEWYATQKQLAVLKEKEMDLRAQAMRILFPSSINAPVAGTTRADLGNGWNLKYEQTFSYKLDKDIAKVKAVLLNFQTGERDLLVRWKPELSVTNYKALVPVRQAIITPILTIKPDAPKLTVEAP